LQGLWSKYQAADFISDSIFAQAEICDSSGRLHWADTENLAHALNNNLLSIVLIITPLLETRADRHLDMFLLIASKSVALVMDISGESFPNGLHNMIRDVAAPDNIDAWVLAEPFFNPIK
jgi:hypothetical protein